MSGRPSKRSRRTPQVGDGKTKSLRLADDVLALLRARNPLLWVVTREEARVEGYLASAAATAGYTVRFWDVAQGFTDAAGAQVQGIGLANDPDRALDIIGQRAQNGTERGAWIMRDLTAWLAPPIGLTQLRRLRNLARSLPMTPRDRAQVVIVVTPFPDVPPDLANQATVIEWPLPDRDEIAARLDASIQGLPDDARAAVIKALGSTRDAIVDASVGLSDEEAQATYARSLVQSKRIDPGAVAREKKRIIAKERVLEWHDPLPGGLDAVGGLANLKEWLLLRQLAHSESARAYGLPPPKGALLVGIPGTGKSHTAKAISTAWNVPLLRLDLGALKSKFVGESEANLRRALRVVEAIGRCVVWIDEIEKALAGATQGAADGGVSADALGGLLSWMQERQGEAFVIATANDVSALPPELLRKGRFDEVWWIDLPTPTERVAILKAALTAHGRGEVDIDHAAVAKACDGFTGSEIAALVPDALFTAFADGAREIDTADLQAAATTVVPLSKTAAERIESLRKWAKGRARPASRNEEGAPAQQTARVLDI
jgi:hypothetical protein